MFTRATEKSKILVSWSTVGLKKKVQRTTCFDSAVAVLFYALYFLCNLWGSFGLHARILRLNCISFGNFSYVRKNHALLGSILASVDFLARDECESKCIFNQLCKSVNIHNNGTCQLNSKSASDPKDNSKLVQMQHWTFLSTSYTERWLGPYCTRFDLCGPGYLCQDTCTCPGHICIHGGKFIIRHYNGLCVSPRLTDNVLHLTKSCTDLFTYTHVGALKHIKSNACMQTASPERGSVFLSSAACAERHWSFEQTQQFSVRHLSSGNCLHPSGGNISPWPNTVVILHPWCDDDRLQFKFVYAFSIDYDEETSMFDTECEKFMKGFVKDVFSPWYKHSIARLWFSRFIDSKRVDFKEVEEVTFLRLVQYFAIVLFECSTSDDFEPATKLLNMSFTFYQISGFQGGKPKEPAKQYIYNFLKDQAIWKSIRFWTSAFLFAVDNERKKRPKKGSWSSLNEEERKEVNYTEEHSAFGHLGSFLHMMKTLDLPTSLIEEFFAKICTIENLSRDQMEELGNRIDVD
eukprot:gene18638-20519_t